MNCKKINIVLYEPEIPQNTGNVMRTCAATGSLLHLIEPLGFSLDQKSLRRAGLDYINELEYKTYGSYDEFKEKNSGEFFFMTRYGKKPHSDFDYTSVDKDIYLIFGKESMGIDKQILRNNLDRCFRLPMRKGIRSLNLSNCVAVCLYEVLRQLEYKGLSFAETIKDRNFLEKN